MNLASKRLARMRTRFRLAVRTCAALAPLRQPWSRRAIIGALLPMAAVCARLLAHGAAQGESETADSARLAASADC